MEGQLLAESWVDSMAEKEQGNHSQTDSDVEAISEAEVAVENPSCEALEKLETEVPEVLSALTDDQRSKLVGFVAARYEMQSHSGPLPRPEDIALYNKHIPNGADRIMAMAEEQAKHRQRMESKMVDGHIKQSGTGQKFALVIGITGMVTGAGVALMGHDWVGAGIAGTTVISLVYAFITGQRSQRDVSGEDNSSGEEE